MSVLDEEALVARSIESMENLNARTPNVEASGSNAYGRPSGSFRMRGVPGVTVYVDGVAHSGAAVCSGVSASPLGKLISLASLLFWIAVVTAGRFIAFSGTGTL